MFWGKEKENRLSYLVIHHDTIRKHEGFMDNIKKRQKHPDGQKGTDPCWVLKAQGKCLFSSVCVDPSNYLCQVATWWSGQTGAAFSLSWLFWRSQSDSAVPQFPHLCGMDTNSFHYLASLFWCSNRLGSVLKVLYKSKDVI